MAGRTRKKGKKGKMVARVKPDPGNAAPISNFTDLPTGATAPDVDPDIKQIRMAITAFRRSLFTSLGVNPSKYKHIIRIQPTGASDIAVSGECGCGCS
jgi:hypothetical protein